MKEIDITRLSKRNLLNDIDIFFLKNQMNYDGDIFKLKKKDLIKIMLDYDIPHIDENILKEEILKYEKYNKLRNKILYNYYKYNNIDPDIINDLSDDEKLEAIIEEYNLTEEPIENELEEIIKLTKTIAIAYKNYCVNTNKICNIKYLSLQLVLSNIYKDI